MLARRPIGSSSLLPKRQRGRQSPEAEEHYRRRLGVFCDLVRQIRSTMDFEVGARGWCYILEEHGLRKGDFDAAEKLITICRKDGLLPLDICGEDSARETIGLQNIQENGIAEEVDSWVDYLRNDAHQGYTPVSFWEDLDTCVEVVTEKLDLRNLFEPVCSEFYVPITNLKGWSDLNARAAIMQRFAHWEGTGKQCVLLTCNDHDPGGLHISGTLRKNLQDLSRAVGWSPDNLVITRFGLNADFIRRHRLTWIDNLETSSGKELDDPEHNDHAKAYVQDYIRKFGVKKYEANVLVVKPEIGRRLCRDAIRQYVPGNAPADYQRKLDRIRKRLHRALRQRVA
jgi:hypothetical protein